MARGSDSETYDCNCAGCESGGTFEAAPESWWASKGILPPTRCKGCRDWIASQRGTPPQQVECCECGRDYPFTDKSRIFEHVNNGSWSDLVSKFVCRRCQQQPGWHEKGSYSCEVASCGRTFEGPSERQIAERGWTKPTACPACREQMQREKRLGDVTRRCANALCGCEWVEKAGTRIWRFVHGESGSQYCRRCAEEPERLRQHSYPCKCAACFSGGNFDDRHASFFRKGPPTVCKDCNDWLRKQREIGAISVPCAFCGNRYTIEAFERQRHHFQNEEKWEKYFALNDNLVCRSCQDSLRERGANFHRLVQGRLRGYQQGILVEASTVAAVREQLDRTRTIAEEHGLQADVRSFDVPDDPEFYRQIVEPAKNGDEERSARDHIGKQGHGFEKMGLYAIDGQIAVAAELARRTDENVAQVTQDDGRIVKIDLETGLNVVIVSDNRSPTGVRILTSFVSFGQANRFRNKLRAGKWTSGW